MMAKGFLLGTDYDLVIRGGSIQIGDTTDQEAAIVLRLSQGDLKEDLLVGPGLTKFIRGKSNASQIEQRLRAHFARAGLNYEDYKERIKTTIKTTD